MLDNEQHNERCEECPLYETYDVICQNLLACDALDLINRQKAEIERLEYTLLGVMHSVDKWLDGDELKQGKVERAATMREKTLQIVEEKAAEIERLTSLCASKDVIINSQEADLERLNKNLEAYALQYGTANDQSEKLKSNRAEAVKEFAERLRGRFKTEPILFEELCYKIDILAKELIGGEDTAYDT